MLFWSKLLHFFYRMQLEDNDANYRCGNVAARLYAFTFAIPTLKSLLRMVPPQDANKPFCLQESDELLKWMTCRCKDDTNVISVSIEEDAQGLGHEAIFFLTGLTVYTMQSYYPTRSPASGEMTRKAFADAIEALVATDAVDGLIRWDLKRAEAYKTISMYDNDVPTMKFIDIRLNNAVKLGQPFPKTIVTWQTIPYKEYTRTIRYWDT